MNLSVFGLGYVGAVTSGCLARKGHSVVGVDVQDSKVALISRGESPIVEPGLSDMIREAVQAGRLRATVSCLEAVQQSTISVVCVGTPSAPTGALDLTYVRHVAAEIGAAVRAKAAPHVLVLRSTMLPGSTEAIVRDLLSDLVESGLLTVCYFPEFLREGTAVDDFENPSLAVVGTRGAVRPAEEWMQGLFGTAAEVVDWPTAEMIKYSCNAFHAAKIVFANEVGRLGKQLGVDGRVVMRLLCRDTRLNLSPYYLRPGNPFGGSCLPKDVRAVSHLARQVGAHLPMVESLLTSNDKHLQNLLAMITDLAPAQVVLVGLSFKAGTDDLRESAMVEVAQYLLGRGYPLRIYDPALNLSSLVGSNKRLIDARMPHLASLLKSSLSEAMGEGGLVVVAQKCVGLDEFKASLKPGHTLFDVNGWPELTGLGVPVHGFCW